MLKILKQKRIFNTSSVMVRLIASTAQEGIGGAPFEEKLHDNCDNALDANHYDVIIGGGGLVGTALATAFLKNKTLSEKRVLLLEGAPEFNGFDLNGPYGNRVSAINKNSVELFKKIGIWERMSAQRVKGVKQMQVWDAKSGAHIEFHHDHFCDDVAYIIENNLMLDCFYSMLSNKKDAQNVTVRNKAKICDVKLPSQTNSNVSVVKLQDGDSFSCDLLVGADGANSMIRKEMGVDVFSINYERTGVVATLCLSDNGDNSVAWQRFLPGGPIALLPLTDNLSSLVWSTSKEHASELMKMNDQQFVDALNEAFFKEYSNNDVVTKAVGALNSVFGSFNHKQYPPRISGVQEKSRATFPLGFLHASSYVCAGTALVGDAAHRIHPLAGQGVNLGYSDVNFLIETLADATYAGAKLGDLNYLMKYEQKSLTKNVPILLGVHGLHSLYSTSFPPVVLLRSLGLQFTQNIPFFKNFFMQRAMG